MMMKRLCTTEVKLIETMRKILMIVTPKMKEKETEKGRLKVRSTFNKSYLILWSQTFFANLFYSKQDELLFYACSHRILSKLLATTSHGQESKSYIQDITFEEFIKILGILHAMEVYCLPEFC